MVGKPLRPFQARARYVRSPSAEDIARLLDGTPHEEPEVVRAQRRFEQPAPSWTGIAISAAAVLAFVLFVMALDGGML